jgi:hypothetical protein
VAKLHGAALNADLVENAGDSSHHPGMCGVAGGAQLARRVLYVALSLALATLSPGNLLVFGKVERHNPVI